MDFPTYIEIVARSAPADWNVEEGPLYLHAAPHESKRPTAPKNLSHAFIMAYRKDLSITMAYGMLCEDDIAAPWTAEFPDAHASLRYLDFFFNSALVFRATLMSVDGGQCVLPVPNPGPSSPWEVPRRKADVARLVHQVTNPMRDFDDYFAHAHFKIIDEHWPL
jgi:hypothetical protein